MFASSARSRDRKNVGKVSKALIYEKLMGIDQGLARGEGRLSGTIRDAAVVAVQLENVRSDFSLVRDDIANVGSSLGRIVYRLQRVEKCLDIIEEPAGRTPC